jgi:hypothetical protein
MDLQSARTEIREAELTVEKFMVKVIFPDQECLPFEIEFDAIESLIEKLHQEMPTSLF